jgi:hypothetical protein
VREARCETGLWSYWDGSSSTYASPNFGLESRQLESRPKEEGRLDLEVSAGWVSQHSHGLWGGHALLVPPKPVTLCSALTQAPIKNFRKKGKHGFSEEADYDFDGKILYQRAKNSVFPPLDFDPQTAVRSTKMPSASLTLEHAYGYEGLKNYSNNLFYTDNPDEVRPLATGGGA